MQIRVSGSTLATKSLSLPLSFTLARSEFNGMNRMNELPRTY